MSTAPPAGGSLHSFFHTEDHLEWLHCQFDLDMGGSLDLERRLVEYLLYLVTYELMHSFHRCMRGM